MATHAQETFHAFQNAVAHNMSNFDEALMSDDEEEDYCPLCIEPLDITDKNFFPCPCGYQICQFCYNNIRQNPELNGRCPACRRKYDDEGVRYVVLTAEEIKMERSNQAKKDRERKQREKERKENEFSNRKHLAGVRVIQKNLVYVVGVNPQVPYDEVSTTLRSDKYFGQYGRINKIVVNRKNPHGGDNSHHHTPGYGVYITFASKDDAAKCIAKVDGTYMDGRLIKAAYGTTKYCSSYLRGLSCPNPNCMFLHEPGEEADSFNKREMHGKQQQQQQQQQHSAPVGSGSSAGNIYGKPSSGNIINNGLSSLNTYTSASPSPALAKAQLHNDGNLGNAVLTPAPKPSGANPWGVSQSSTPVTSLNLSKNISGNHLPTLADTLASHNNSQTALQSNLQSNDIENNATNNTTSTTTSSTTTNEKSHGKKKNNNTTTEQNYVDPYDSLGSAVKFMDETIKKFSSYENCNIKLKSSVTKNPTYHNYPSLFTWKNVEPSKKCDKILTKKLIDILAIKPTDYSTSVLQFLQSVSNSNANNPNTTPLPLPLDGELSSSSGTPLPQSNINLQIQPPQGINVGRTMPTSPPGMFSNGNTPDGLGKDNSTPTNNSSDLLNQLINGRSVAANN
ncbi:similar to Saccharomyces cerevisiae YER068W MOT2 Subunit of the CCR4-NOT complex, which has roles in transcription regulation, mRNA degradation, and post-transcriptional modifications [Maudiozyma saulgeensis]|uniref:Similar to Saccharomyces cerevisiae YER068W MOT2 Subunit of the CCR4-NOT complex, which has roles in transcription regulation, mRNA degradation, and post-transcriptional modifications n=1 Tax=Maudiozyma saulgeensis TaxID=1789683 RepID=A0A1X7R2X1_9SACH|nr:similar to Saccharomyces cerevisiae YER068W MOT2 Subunit of the CCR4-NOT complex, which has roles in transcription regulation, mRNA degradation, and post-transcriptional modifications [Kazachstania saulgeensis]